MKYLNRSFIKLLVLLIFLYSCDSGNDDIIDADKSAYLELEIDQSIVSFDRDFWIIITNDEGKILSDSLISAGGNIKFKEHDNEITEYLGIYFFEVSNDSEYFSANGILSVKKNSSLRFDKTRDYGDPDIGQVDIEITNYPNTTVGVNLPVTTNTQEFTYEDAEIIDAENDLLYDTIRFKMSIVQENDTLLIGNAYRDNDPRYLKIEGVNVGDKYSFDFFDDFIPYENMVIHEFSSTERLLLSAFVFGYKNNTSYPISARLTSSDTRLTQFGYIDGFDSYRSSITIGKFDENGYTKYVKKGDPIKINELDLPEFSVKVLNGSFSNFDYSYARELSWRKSSWYGEGNSIFYVYEDLNNPCKQLSRLPEKFSTLYEFIKLDKLEYIRSDFIENIGGYSYETYFGTYFSNYLEAEKFHYYLIQVNGL